MLKIFTTQLAGIFSRIQDKESEAIEDGARLLAQAAVSGHTIYLYGANEMQGILCEAELGSEPMPSVKAFPDTADSITESDRVLMFCSGPGTAEEQELAKSFMKKGSASLAYLLSSKIKPGLRNFVMFILTAN